MLVTLIGLTARIFIWYSKAWLNYMAVSLIFSFLKQQKILALHWTTVTKQTHQVLQM